LELFFIKRYTQFLPRKLFPSSKQRAQFRFHHFQPARIKENSNLIVFLPSLVFFEASSALFLIEIAPLALICVWNTESRFSDRKLASRKLLRPFEISDFVFFSQFLLVFQSKNDLEKNYNDFFLSFESRK